MKIKHRYIRYFIAAAAVTVLFFMLGMSDNNVDFINLELSPLQKNQMQHLGLQESEMREFLLKREIYQGYLNTDRLSPHEVLGILAQDTAKRQQYARAAARIRTKLINDTKNFETLYLEEVSRLTNPP
ncbi:MAG: hypothetical protein GDA45_06330 [Chromatiales bacterium]|nr:hypothetical protein [Chromatiales bacterium]